MENMGFYRVNQPEPMAVIAGTFCLMSCSMQIKSNAYVGKLIDNFNFLADCDALDDRFRTICRRMACHWESAQMTSRAQDDGEPPVCAQFGVSESHSLRSVIAPIADPGSQPEALPPVSESSCTLPLLFTTAEAMAYARDVLEHISQSRALPRE
jgi:hypothetical protein